jgi:trans-o-hydroxybenzylidenepyruvate hydratase-aldolase
MLTKADIKGLCIMVPTPTIEGGDTWETVSSVNLEESARMTEIVIRDGVGSIAACGTTGENACLLWEEKLDFIDTLVQTNKGRVPVFAGATALGTKETVRQMRAMKDIGADGVFVGLALWQTPTAYNSVKWFQDLAEAVPDMPIMVYSNSMFFKSVFPTEFWAGIAQKAPTVITNKIASPFIGEHLEEIVKVAGHQIAFLPQQRAAHNARERCGEMIQGLWSSGQAIMGAAPVSALWDAIESGDEKRYAEVLADIDSVPPSMPPDRRAEDFPKYNVQLNKVGSNASGYINGGPVRAPYQDLPEDYQRMCEAAGKGWAKIQEKYSKARVS